MLMLWCWICLFITSYILHGSEILNLVIVLGYIIVLFSLLIKKESFFIISSFFLWSIFTTAISGLILETGVFLPELGEMSTLNGATAVNLSLAIITLLIASNIFVFMNDRILVNLNTSFFLNAIIERIYPVMVLLATFVVIFFFIKFGRPSDYGQDRFYYWNNVAPSWGNLVRLFVEQSAFILGCIYARTKSKIILGVFLLGLISQILVGEKFTGIFQMLLFFSVCFLIASNKTISKKLFSFRSILIFSALGVVFIILVWTSYFSLSGDSSLAFESLKTRIAAQSQLWWSLTENARNADIDILHITDNFFGIGVQPENTGMLYLMGLVMPQQLFNVYQEAGIALTMAFPANILLFFGPFLSLLVCSILAVFLALALWFTVYTLRNRDYILLFIAMKVFNIAIQFILMGRVYLLFEWKIILLLLPLIFALVAHSKNRVYGTNA
ncbi:MULTISPECIES: DUF6418 domain-containing protein [Enterobacter cloacae complex]|uniref:DUF6418 domain-containing protein n=1 Tax=Enterobacter genomosp. O TaxID=2364150 RepID=A0A0X4EQW8_9ENTR|nr:MULTISPECIES: DUF6418 domain-containing protein [Enterobacter cloacae complex]KUQ84109.1 hypothetical protein AWI28_14175 [Enterobacter genomosp. O]MCM7108977.1 DUF6418 domain-containing protein [Enterobacter cloacae]